MEVNLRKASALAKALANSLRHQKGAESTMGIVVSVHANKMIDEIVSEKVERVREKINAAAAGTAALYKIRSAIGRANEANDINRLVAELKSIEDTKSEINAAHATMFVDDGDVDHRAKLNKMRDRQISKDEYFGRSEDSIVIGYPREFKDELEEMIRNLELRKQKIDEQLIIKNISNNITLDGDVVAVLRNRKLI
jgi:hypothetical protein